MLFHASVRRSAKCRTIAEKSEKDGQTLGVKIHQHSVTGTPARQHVSTSPRQHVSTSARQLEDCLNSTNCLNSPLYRGDRKRDPRLKSTKRLGSLYEGEFVRRISKRHHSRHLSSWTTTPTASQRATRTMMTDTKRE